MGSAMVVFVFARPGGTLSPTRGKFKPPARRSGTNEAACDLIAQARIEAQEYEDAQAALLAVLVARGRFQGRSHVNKHSPGSRRRGRIHAADMLPPRPGSAHPRAQAERRGEGARLDFGLARVDAARALLEDRGFACLEPLEAHRDVLVIGRRRDRIAVAAVGEGVDARAVGQAFAITGWVGLAVAVRKREQAV